MDSLHALLRSLRRGNAIADLDDALAQLVASVRETGKAGTLTLKLRVEPADKDSRTVFVTDEIASKLPKREPGKSIFYIDHQGRLTRNDPDQPDLPGLVKDLAADGVTVSIRNA